MLLFQTPRGKISNKYHILLQQKDNYYESICSQGVHWGHIKDDIPKVIEFSEEFHDKICPCCILEGYKRGLLKINIEKIREE